MYELPDIPPTKSSLISSIAYDEITLELTIQFRKYYVDELTYSGVPINIFDEFFMSKSFGKFYLSKIKPNFKLKSNTMADRPETVNKCSDQKRYIKISINTDEIKKEWIHVGEKGKYLNVTLALLPDGDLDPYGNLGMVTQDVPKAIFDKEKNLKAEKRTRGPILGNGAEFARKNAEGAPGSETGVLLTAGSNDDDDLPF